MRLKSVFQEKIYKDYSAGKKYTETKLYRYSIQYNPISAIHTWIVRQKKNRRGPAGDTGQYTMGVGTTAGLPVNTVNGSLP